MNGGHAGFFVIQSVNDTHYYRSKSRNIRQHKKIDKRFPVIHRGIRAADRRVDDGNIGGLIILYMIGPAFILVMLAVLGWFPVALLGLGALGAWIYSKIKLRRAIMASRRMRFLKKEGFI